MILPTKSIIRKMYFISITDSDCNPGGINTVQVIFIKKYELMYLDL